jgi:capsular polysaccharide transport system permease protein
MIDNVQEEYRLSLRKAVLQQIRVLKALLLREMSLRLGPQRFGYIFVVTEMIWGASFIGLIKYLLEQPAPYGNSVVFYTFVGMFVFTLYKTLQTRVGGAIQANRALLSFPAITPLDTLLARAGLEVSFQMIAFLLFYGVFIWMDLALSPAHPIELVMDIAATILLGFGLGTTSMILQSVWRAWGTVDRMIARSLFFASGIFYQVEYLPSYIRDVLVWNPLVHAIEWIRYCIFPNYFTQILDREYLLAWGLISTVFGLGMERLLRAWLLEGS